MAGGIDASSCCARLGRLLMLLMLRLLSAAGPLGGLKGFDELIGVEGTDCDDDDRPPRGPVGMLLAPVVADAEAGPAAGGRPRLWIVLPQPGPPRPRP